MTDHDTQQLEEQAQALLDDEAYEEVLELLEGADAPALVRMRAEALMELEDYEESEEEWDRLELTLEEAGFEPEPGAYGHHHG